MTLLICDVLVRLRRPTSHWLELLGELLGLHLIKKVAKLRLHSVCLALSVESD